MQVPPWTVKLGLEGWVWIKGFDPTCSTHLSLHWLSIETVKSLRTRPRESMVLSYLLLSGIGEVLAASFCLEPGTWRAEMTHFT